MTIKEQVGMTKTEKTLTQIEDELKQIYGENFLDATIVQLKRSEIRGGMGALINEMRASVKEINILAGGKEDYKLKSPFYEQYSEKFYSYLARCEEYFPEIMQFTYFPKKELPPRTAGMYSIIVQMFIRMIEYRQTVLDLKDDIRIERVRFESQKKDWEGGKNQIISVTPGISDQELTSNIVFIMQNENNKMKDEITNLHKKIRELEIIVKTQKTSLIQLSSQPKRYGKRFIWANSETGLKNIIEYSKEFIKYRQNIDNYVNDVDDNGNLILYYPKEDKEEGIPEPLFEWMKNRLTEQEALTLISGAQNEVNTKLIFLTPQEQKIAEEILKSKDNFTTDQIRETCEGKFCKREAITNTLKKLVDKGNIKRIERGHYTILDRQI